MNLNTTKGGEGTSSTASLLGGSSRQKRYPAMLPHRPLPSTINHSTLHELQRDLWGPSFEFAEFALDALFDSFEWALREKALAGQIKPFGYNSTLSTVGQIVHLSQYMYDPRADSVFEVDEEEPQNFSQDNHLPKSAKIQNDQSTAINQVRRDKSPPLIVPGSIGDGEKSSFGQSQGVRKKTAGSAQKRLTKIPGYEEQLTPAKEQIPEQVKLPPPELRPYEIMTKDQELQVEFLRISQAKKEAIRLEHQRKMQQLKQDEELAQTQGGDDGEDGAAADDKPVPNPVKLDKLPPTFRLPRTNLEQPTQATRDNDYARLIKALQGLKKKQSQSTLQQNSVNSVQKSQANLLDPQNLIKSSGINAEHNPSELKKPVFMEPPSKTLKATFGVHYKEPKVTIEGEPYENRPSDKKRMTRSQFLEMSQTESKILRDTNVSASIDGDMSKILNQQDSLETTLMMPLTANSSVEKNLSVSQQFNALNHTLNDSQSIVQTIKHVINDVPLRRSIHQLSQRSNIKLLSPTGAQLLLQNQFSPSAFRMKRDDASSVTESGIFSKGALKASAVPKFLPAIVSPQESKVSLGMASLQRSVDFSYKGGLKTLRSTRNSHIRLQSLNERGFNTLEGGPSLMDGEKVFQYRPSDQNDPLDAQSAHDKLNLMIVRGQDTASYIDSFNSSIITSPQVQPLASKGIPSLLKPSPLQLRYQYAIGSGQQEIEPHMALHQPIPGTILHSHRQSLAERGQRAIKVHSKFEF